MKLYNVTIKPFRRHGEHRPIVHVYTVRAESEVEAQMKATEKYLADVDLRIKSVEVEEETDQIFLRASYRATEA